MRQKFWLRVLSHIGVEVNQSDWLGLHNKGSYKTKGDAFEIENFPNSTTLGWSRLAGR